MGREAQAHGRWAYGTGVNLGDGRGLSVPALCALGSSEHGCVEVSSGNRSLHLYPYLAWRVQLYAHPNPVRGGVPPPARWRGGRWGSTPTAGGVVGLSGAGTLTTGGVEWDGGLQQYSAEPVRPIVRPVNGVVLVDGLSRR